MDSVYICREDILEIMVVQLFHLSVNGEEYFRQIELDEKKSEMRFILN